MLIARTFLFAAVLCSTAAPAALAADARMEQYRDGRLRTDLTSKIVFDDWAQFTQGAGAMEGTPSLGNFVLIRKLDAERQCKITLSVAGVRLPARLGPRVSGGVLRLARPSSWGMRRFRFTEHDERWYRRGTVGVGLVPAPAWLAGTPVVAVRASLAVEAERWRTRADGYEPLEVTRRQVEVCRGRLARIQASVLRLVLHTARVEART